MSDIKTEIRFGAASAVDREHIKQSKGVDIIRRRQDQAAEEMGRKIAEVKGWKMRPDGEMCISELQVYVFTPSELQDFISAKIKQRLLDFAERA